MYVILTLVVCVANVFCIVIGAKLGQAVSKGEEIKTPNLSPLSVYREFREKREADKEQKKADMIFQNIECYDGTSQGQKDV